jgi:hypothetical protein
MFLNDNQQNTLRRIVNGQSRYDSTLLYRVLCTMLHVDIVRNGKITIADDSITIKAYGKSQKTNLKTP